MTPYYYQKKGPPKPKIWEKLTFPKRKILAFFALFSGFAFLFSVFWPILEWQVLRAPKLTTPEILRPIPEVIAKNLGDPQSKITFDYSKASSWFPQMSQKPHFSRVSSYTLSLPKLKIFQATVIIGAEELEKSLIHYGGTALPGEMGSAVIFGHSVLPQFFDPKNYKTIFSTLHTLKIGDEVLVNFDGVEYKYKVFETEIVEPTNISVLEQKYDDSYLLLITCTPPGTYWKRLVVKTKIEKLQ